MTDTINKLSDKLVNNNKWHYLFFCVLLLILTVYCEWVNTPFIHGHDTRAHYTRIYELMQVMLDGRFPWYIDYNELNSYGYFMKAFYCDILLIPFAIIGLLTDSFIAFRAMITATTLTTGVVTFWAVNRIYKNNKTACVAALLYTFCNYRLIDSYIRGAVGEVFAMLALPIILLGIYELINGNYRKWYILSIGCSVLIYSHLISTLLVFTLLTIVVLIYIKRFVNEPIRIKYLVIAALSTVFLTAYYLFPMLEQMLSNEFLYKDSSSEGILLLQTTGLSIKQLFMGLLSAIPDTPPKVFVPHIGILLSMSILLRFFVSEKTVKRKYADAMAIIGLIIYCISWKYFPWHIFPFKLFTVILFPWRPYMFVSLFFTLAGAYYISTLLKTNKQYIVYVVALAFMCCLPITAESLTTKHKEYSKNIDENIVLRTTPNTILFDYGAGNEYMPALCMSNMGNILFGERATNSQDSTTLITNYKLEKGLISFDINQPDKIEIPQTYYLGYAAYVNDKPVELSQSDKGLISLDIKESGKAEVYYKATTIQVISTIITCLSILALCFYIFRIHRKRKRATIVE